MRPRLIPVVMALALAACAGKPPALPIAAPDSLRAVTGGDVVGFRNPAGGYTWLGIPYAAAPVGPLRWRPPQPPAAWRGVRTALAAGSPCIQYGWPVGGVGKNGTHQGSEDCLYLNVYTPALDAKAAHRARLPVMVWVHGGSNTVGHAAAYDGGQLANREHVVVVMINYRLGPFGWFVVPPGGAAGQPVVDPIEASGNWGILDLLATLRWVQENASAFGGDPGNVTVFGESAGATDALALLISPLTTGLLHKVIIESMGFGLAAMPRVTHYTDDANPGGEYSSGEILLKLLVREGRAQNRAAAKQLVASWSRDDVAAFLRGIDPWTLYAAYHPSSIETAKFPTVFQDGAVIRDGALEDLLADPSRHLSVPTLIGSNRDEPKLFMAFDPRLVVTLGGMPVWIRDPASYDREAHYRALLWKANAVDSVARALSAGGTPVFAYRWDWRDEGRRYGFLDATRLLGAAHGLEIPFVLGDFSSGTGADLLFTKSNAAARVALSSAMMSYWTEFAAAGRPDAGRDGTLALWGPWSAAPGEQRLMIFDTPAGGGIRVSNEEATREGVIALMEAQEPDDPPACAMFRATFRTRDDPFAMAAWQRFKGGYCAARELNAYAAPAAARSSRGTR
jgi:para-nitrobenzyl esterase